MKINKLERFLYFLFTSAIFLYLVLRGINAGPLNDESLTFLTWVHNGKIIPFDPYSDVSANNHFLNTLLTWVCYKAFGVSEWVIRLPNLFAFPIYIWYLYKLGRLISTHYLRWLFWLFLTFVHYYIEFFAYCRGYGLSLAFLAGSLYHLIQADNVKDIRHLNRGLLLILLATLSNLNLLITFLLWILVSIKILRNQDPPKKVLKNYYIKISIPIIFFAAWSITLKAKNSLSYGQDSIYSSLQSLISLFSDSSINILTILLALLTVFIFILGGYFLIKQKFIHNISGLTIFYLFLFLNLFGTIVLHYSLGIKFPSGRTGFHWYFFLAGAIPFVFDRLRPPLKIIFTMSVFGIFLPIFNHSLRSVNFYYSVDPEWRKQQISDNLYKEMVELNKGGEFPLSLQAFDNLYTVNMAFKNLKYRGSINYCQDSPNANFVNTSDVLIVDTSDHPDITGQYHHIFYDPVSTMSLMKRKTILHGKHIDSNLLRHDQYSEEGFTLLADFILTDDHPGNSFRINYDLDLTSSENPLLSLLTIEVRDENDQLISYRQAHLDYLETNFSDDFEYKLSLTLDNTPENAHEIRCFLWNFEKKSFIINSAKTTLLQLN